MIRQNLPKALALFGGAAVVLLLVLYALAPGPAQPSSSSARVDVDRTTAAQTAYAPVTPLPPLTPTPSPDRRPRVVSVADCVGPTCAAEPVVRYLDLAAGSFVTGRLAGARLLVRRADGVSEVLRADGTVQAPLPAPQYAVFDVSLDGRLVVWLDGGRLYGYDVGTPENAQSPRDPLRSTPSGFRESLADASLLLCTNDACPMSVLVDPAGNAGDTLPTGPDAIAASTDGQQLAWQAGGVVRVYDRATRATRTYDLAQDIAGGLAWSFHGREIAYIRAVSDTDVRVAVLDLASGVAHDVYTAPPDPRVRDLVFTGPHTLQFELPSLELYRIGSEPLHGPRYAINDDGTGGRSLDDLRRPWATCGPACGLPPPGYEDAHGLAWWCELVQPAAVCRFHLDVVVRGDGIMRELTTIDEPEAYPSQAALSPDGRRIAIVTAHSDGIETLHLVSVTAGGNTADVTLGSTDVTSAVWLPDGTGVLLFSVART